MLLLEKITSMTSVCDIRLKLGPLVDLETIMACENIRNSLKSKVVIHGYKKSEKVNINLDNPLNYRATNINEKIEEADLILLVNLDLKNEIPLFNVRLANQVKKSVKTAGATVGLIGSNIDSTFNYEHIGFDLKDFIHLLEGNDKFLNKIINAKAPLILFGENCFEWNLNSFNTFLTKINTNTSFSILNHNVVAAGLGECGYTINSMTGSTDNVRIFIDIDHISSSDEIREAGGF